MKKNATPELDAGWWRKHQADGLGNAKELERALEAQAQAREASDREAWLKALDSVEQAVKKVQGDIDKALKKGPKTEAAQEDLQHTAQALERYAKVIDTARAEARKLPDEDDDSVFGQPERYAAYLQAAFNKLKHGPLHFAFGASSKPAEHRLALHRSTSPNALASKLRNQTVLKKLTYGVASSDPARANTLVLALQGPVLTGLNAKYKRIRKQFGPLYFDRVKVLVNGKEIIDEPDPTDPPDEDGDTDTPVRTLAAQGSALATWQTARSHAVETLRRLGAAIAQVQDPQAREAEIRLQAVIRQLTPAPETAQQVAELQRWLANDEVFDDLATPNPFGLNLHLRAPLVAAAATLKA